YLNTLAHPELEVDSVQDIIAFNSKDSLLHAPYGQGIFMGITQESRSQEEFEPEKRKIMQSAKKYFEEIFNSYQLDGLLSIDNYSARNAAAAHYPALGVPMGYTNKGQPKNLTFIVPSRNEQRLLELGVAFERLSPSRKIPTLFK
ncbi:MAG: amidase, partial [Flavobacteriaceae bacterium]